MCSHIDMHSHVPPPIPIAKVKTLIRGLGLGFDLRISACRVPTMYYMSTDFGADSSSRVPFGAQTNRQMRLNALPARRRLYSRRG